MKNAMRKTTLREIKGSFSRWIAILAICMLGVGFFCGLKVCKEAFILTGDTFLSDNCFYDYELISTLGLEEKDVAKFQDLEGIAKARGSYSSDALFLISKDKDAADGYDEDVGERVAKFHALIDDMNTPALSYGRLRTNASAMQGIFLNPTSAKKSLSARITTKTRKICLPMILTKSSGFASPRFI